MAVVLLASKFQEIEIGAQTLGPSRPGKIRVCNLLQQEINMNEMLKRLWIQDDAQDIAEYAVMLAVILVIVIGTIRLIGTNANNAFSAVASSIQQ